MNYFDIDHHDWNLSDSFGTSNPSVINSKLWSWNSITEHFSVQDATGRKEYIIEDYNQVYRGRYEEIGNEKRVSFVALHLIFQKNLWQN
jgi:hypothetical protein